eukprot:GGOE01009843.1.p1 GENE.GGOE01009843.1~~GGOE01009843.1.p1  ORF type:complete len:801 (-),score=230.36 GGOE01009843.1:554-2677(-)
MTTVVYHKLNNGLIISVLDAQNRPGALLSNAKNTLPQTDATLHSIAMFCSLDDAVALSVFHYCNNYLELERPSNEDVKKVMEFSEEVQMGKHTPELLPLNGFSKDQLENWLCRCPASFVRCTLAPYAYRLYTLSEMDRHSGEPAIAWTADPDTLRFDLPPQADSGMEDGRARRALKREKLAAAFWIYGSVSSLPSLKVLQVACWVLLNCKLSVDQAHTDTIWNDQGKPTVLFRFLVFPVEESAASEASLQLIAEKALVDLRQAMGSSTRELAQCISSSPERSRVFSHSDSSFSDDSSENMSSEESSYLGASTMQQVVRSGALLKQQRHGLLRLWQRRWFHLTGHVLAYSKALDSSVFKTLNLLHLTIVLSDARKHAFCLANADGKSVLNLACSSEQERAQWWQAIKSAQRSVELPRTEGALTPRETDWDSEAMLQYQRLCCLGRGATGKVWKVRDRETGDMLAVKMMSKDQIARQHLENVVMAEKAILQRLKHPFVVGLHASFETPTKLCLVLDYHSGGTLLELLKKWTRIPQAVAQFYATEIALALKYLHSQNVIHRDLKTSNVLINGSGHAILSDFGIAVGCLEAQTFCGTPDYLAPEVVAHRTYTAAVDWWCYGVALYHMLVGKLPFMSEGTNAGGTIYRNILSDDPDYSSAALTPDATSLLKGLLQKDPDRRFSFEQLVAEPFFEAVDWAAALRMKLPCPSFP